VMAKKPKIDSDQADEADAGTRKPGLFASRRIVAATAGAILLLLAGGAGAYLTVGGDATGETSALTAEAAPTAYYYDLPVMIVNLSTVDSRTSYVKLEVALEVPEQRMIDILQPNLPRVLDAFQTHLRELRPSDLEGSAGLFRLKEELQRRVNLAVYPARIDDVLFKNVIVQ
jgi:flagellar FliL protein